MKYSTVIDIGSSKVMCMTTGSDSDGAIVVQGVGIRNYRGYRLGVLPTVGALSEALEAAINEAQEKSGIRIKSACVGVPLPFTKTIVTSCEVDVESRGFRVSRRDVDYLLELSCDPPAPHGYELMHSTPFGFTLDGTDSDSSPVGKSADKLGAQVAHMFVRTDFRIMVSDILRSIGIEADPFVSSAMACAIFTIPFEERRRGALLIDCGGSHCDISFICENALVFSESIGIGGEHITNDIAMGLRLPYASADELKRRFVYGIDYESGLERLHLPSGEIVLVEYGDLQMIVESRTDELGQMMFEVICDAVPGLSPDTPVYMVGGGIALMRGGAEYLSSCIGRDININMPRTSLLNTISYAPAFGLAQFMLYGSGASVKNNSKIISNIREFFIS